MWGGGGGRREIERELNSGPPDCNSSGLHSFFFFYTRKLFFQPRLKILVLEFLFLIINYSSWWMGLGCGVGGGGEGG